MPQIFMRAKDVHKKICAGMRDDWAGYSIVGDDVTLAAGKAILYDTDAGRWETFDIAEKVITLTTGVNRIYVYYNSGSPEFFNDTTFSAPLNLEDYAIIVTYLKDASGNQASDFNNYCTNIVSKLGIRSVNEPGAIFFTNNPQTVLSSNASDHVIIEALNAFQGAKNLNPLDLPAFDSSTDDMYVYTYNGTVWVKETPTVSVYDRTRYQTPTGTAAVTSNNWTVNYIYRSLFSVLEGAPNPKETFILLGSGNYVNSTLALADNTNLNPYAIPLELGFNAVLVGRIICQNGVSASIVQGNYLNKPDFVTA